MTDTNGEDTRGEISINSPLVIEWKVDFVLLSKGQAFKFESPKFQFLDDAWFLRCFPKGDVFENQNHVSLYLGRSSFVSPSRIIVYELGIWNADGTVYFTTGYDEWVFSKKYPAWGPSTFIERSSLMRDKLLIAPRGIVTFFCHLRTEAAVHGEFQTLRPEGTSISTQTSKENVNAEEETLTGTDEQIEEEQKYSEEIKDKGNFRGKGSVEEFAKLSADLRELFISGKGSDVTFSVQDREFKAHRNILRARLPFFDSMFTHDTEENNSGEVTISDCIPEVFEKLLLYLYSGSVEKISSSNVVGLYQVADKYGIIPVKEQCVQFMMDNLSVETFCDVIALALQYNERTLIEEATNLFVNNEKEIIVGVQWLCFLKEHPVEANELHIKALEGRKS